MPAKREPDVIDVNIRWEVWLGARRTAAYLMGFVRAHDRNAAMRAARSQSILKAGVRGFVEREEF